MTSCGRNLPKSKDSTQFLGLPVEIRLLIYGELLVADRRCKLYARFGARIDLPFYPQILQVNRQIHTEAVSMLYEKNTFSLVLGDDMHIMGRRHVKDEELPRSFFCGSIDNELQGYRYPGLVPAYSFQRMARIVLYISLTAVFDPLSIENHFSRIAALLLQLLQVLSDDPVPSKVQGNKELVIAAETISRPPGGLIGLFHVLGFRPGTIMQAVQAEMEQTAIQACSLLENISKKRNVIIYEDALIDGKGLVTKYNVREIALKDFGNL